MVQFSKYAFISRFCASDIDNKSGMYQLKCWILVFKRCFGGRYYPLNFFLISHPYLIPFLQKRVIYNRVGKCGSRSMIQLMSSLARKRDFTVIGSTRYNLLHLDLRDQVTDVNLYSYTRYSITAPRCQFTLIYKELFNCFLGYRSL